MNYKNIKIKEGITAHLIKTDKFKTNLIVIFLTIPLTRKNVTFNAMIPSILRRGCKTMPSQEIISKELENMYGADFDCGINKTGDNHVLKFYFECVNDEYLPQTGENMLKTCVDKLTEIVFNPCLENGIFKEEFIKQEKENMSQIIESKIDNKAAYAKARCVQEMYGDEPAGLYRFGYVEDIDNINNKNLYEHYLKLIDECKIDIFISGDIDEEECKKILNENENISKLNGRNPNYSIVKSEIKEETEENIVTECKDVNQGKLVIGCDIILDEEDLNTRNLKYQAMLYNSLLGGSANSKLFQNVREKASLAYTASSSYVRYKSNIFIIAGIEIENYEKALNIIKEQIESMKKGEISIEDIENDKKGIVSQIDIIDDEQDSEIMYFFGQELSDVFVDLNEYKEGIKSVTKEQIENIAKKVKINTIYFLKNN